MRANCTPTRPRSIAQAGVLGDSYVDITSKNATGPPPADRSELKSVDAPSIQEVVASSQEGIKKVTVLVGKLDTLIDSLNSKQGTAGKFINDPALYEKLTRVTANLETITRTMASGKGTLGLLIHDDTLYKRATSAIDRLNNITVELDEGKGTAGKLLKDDTLYKNSELRGCPDERTCSQHQCRQGSPGQALQGSGFCQQA